MSFSLENLNKEQWEAVQHDEGPLLILAGAGSGKTRVLVSRIQKLMESQEDGVGICALTFTNKAAKELKQRVSQSLSKKLVKKLWAGTFHSFGLQLLRRYAKEAGLIKNFSIASSADGQAVVKDLLINFKQREGRGINPDPIIEVIHGLRTKQVHFPEVDEETLELARYLAPKYEERMDQLGIIDFHGLLFRTYDLFCRHPDICEKVQDQFPYLMVDEFQDTNLLQMRILKKMTEKRENIAVVGDDDQAIYGWRGAEVRNILDFPKKYPGCRVIELSRNYRSKSEILDLANEVIRHNRDRHGKVLTAEKGEGGGPGSLPEVFVFENDEEEVSRIADLIEEGLREGCRPQDIAILYRSNGQGDLIEPELRARNIPYKISGGTGLFDRREVRDFVAYMGCCLKEKEVDLRRILNVPQRGIGEETYKKIQSYTENLGIPFAKGVAEFERIDDIGSRGQSGLELFRQQLQGLKDFFRHGQPIDTERFLLQFFQDIGYRKYLERYCKNDEALQKRWRSFAVIIRVLCNSLIREKNMSRGLIKFLDMIMLRDCEDQLAPSQEASVQLTTFHGSKGLEWPMVFLVGIEEELLPHQKLGKDISEERRLFYVGITRAQEKLIVSHVRQRKKFGAMRDVAPSRFLLEVDPKFYQKFDTGYRPLKQGEREQMLADLRAKLSSKIDSAGV